MKIRSSIVHVLLFHLIILLHTAYPGILPNPRISKGKTVKTSSNDASMVVDGVYSNWSAWQVSNNSWAAIELGEGPRKIFLIWHNPAYTWSDKIADPKRADCKQTLAYPVNYTISTSANSTNGKDGEWLTKVTISGNSVSVRGHLLDFTGARWVKMHISNGGGSIDEIEIFDASEGCNDSWFFAGTSISANVYKSFFPADNFAAIINKNIGTYYPAVIHGGIPCISSSQFARDISMYLQIAGNCRYWAIEMGTNDAWGGSDANVNTFKSNLQLVIDSCKSHGIEPIIARVLGTNPTANSGNWQVSNKFVKAIDDLTQMNNLSQGPDFFQAALDNPLILGADGVHPGELGATIINKLWAEKMSFLYQAVVNKNNYVSNDDLPAYIPITIDLAQKNMVINCKEAGTLYFFTLRGERLKTLNLPGNTTTIIKKNQGFNVIQFRGLKGITTVNTSVSF